MSQVKSSTFHPLSGRGVPGGAFQAGRKVIRVTVQDKVYAPYYFNCKDCGDALVIEAERFLGICEMCSFVKEMEADAMFQVSGSTCQAVKR